MTSSAADAEQRENNPVEIGRQPISDPCLLQGLTLVGVENELPGPGDQDRYDKHGVCRTEDQATHSSGQIRRWQARNRASYVPEQ